jgi:hypothetical protein
MKEITIKLSDKDLKLIEKSYDSIEWGWNGGYHLEHKIVEKVVKAVTTKKNKIKEI